MKKYVLIGLLFLMNLPIAYAQKNKTTMKEIIGKAWYPVQRQTEYPQVLYFKNENNISGGDGCNSFYANYKYHAKKGFTLGSQVVTEKYCPSHQGGFDAHFLAHCHHFVLEGEKLTFYDRAGKEVMILYARVMIDNTIEPQDKILLPIKTKE
jgi:heat shock protein HslJ